jgi:3-hydroxyphenylacetate 6-hydroxylase
MAIANILHALQQNVVEHTLQSALIAFIIIPLAYVISNEVVRYRARIPNLDGPKGLPLIGNLWDIHGINAAEKYRSWAKRWGDVYQIQLGNIPVVVVNTAASAKVLFGHNSQAFSSRPEFYTFHKVRFYSPRGLYS